MIVFDTRTRAYACARISDLILSFKLFFETLLMYRFYSNWHPDVCLSLIRERARTRIREERAVFALNYLVISEIFISRSSCFRLCDCGTLFFQSQREKIFLSL